MKRFPLSSVTGSFFAAGMTAALLLGAGWLARGGEDGEASKDKKSGVSSREETRKPSVAVEEDEGGPEEAGPRSAAVPAPAAPAEKQRRGGVSPASRERLDMMLPPGRTHTGVRFPEYLTIAPDPENLDPVTGAPVPVTAPLVSLFETELMTRLSADHVLLEGTKWSQFDEESGGNALKLLVELRSGIYNLKSGILVSSQPVRIENETLSIEGNSMLHDRATGLTRLTGDVCLRFFEMEKPGNAPAAGAAPGKPAAAPNKEH